VLFRVPGYHFIHDEDWCVVRSTCPIAKELAGIKAQEELITLGAGVGGGGGAQGRMERSTAPGRHV
jgi:hypothetical protein